MYIYTDFTNTFIFSFQIEKQTALTGWPRKFQLRKPKEREMMKKFLKQHHLLKNTI